ncbi:MAG TPA: AMP-binding protein, partial [Candidatus Acidoferrum sp.]|nr:AMP-binding protein [Candidatus Acidoferrum sp.]
MSERSHAIESLFEETRRFEPSAALAAQANAGPEIYEEADRDYLAFWAKWARELEWITPFTQTLEWNEPFARWFGDGELNVSANCLDRHVAAGRGDRVAFYFEGEPGDRRTITYRELLDDVNRFSNGLRTLGIGKGDPVAIYMPMIPELAVAMLACTRIGAIHSVIFGGFSPESIADRVNDSECLALITADAGWRRGKRIPLKHNCDVAMQSTPSIRHCIVAQRTGDDVSMRDGRDHFWSEVIAKQSTTCAPETMNAEDPLFL